MTPPKVIYNVLNLHAKTITTELIACFFFSGQFLNFPSSRKRSDVKTIESFSARHNVLHFLHRAQFLTPNYKPSVHFALSRAAPHPLLMC